MMESVVLSTAYLPPVQYLTKFLYCDHIEVEQFESFKKQSYRNRCRILGANGLQDLIIPVVKTNGNHTLTKDIKIDYSTRWQMNHWRSIVSAYNSSPFLEYYIDEFEPFYRKTWDYLLDFNHELLDVVLSILGIDNKIQLTQNFEHSYSGKIDLRDAMHPKPLKGSIDILFSPAPYTQTFNERQPFVPNLSIIDLIVNCGPGATTILSESIVK